MMLTNYIIKIYQLNIYLIIIIVVSSCTDVVPRDRPTIGANQQIATEDEPSNTESIPTRPDQAIVIQSNICACKDGQAISYGVCAGVCATKNTGSTPTLFFDVTVNAEIQLSDMKDLFGWCNLELIDPNTGVTVAGQTNPTCVIEAKDENNKVSVLNFTPASGSSSVQVDISSLDESMTYRFKIVEVSSGASSKTNQFRIVANTIDEKAKGPLKINPVSQYTCMSLTPSSNDVEIFFEDASRLFFYFIEEKRPDAIQGEASNIYCHNVQDPNNGRIDPGNERLEEIPGVFSLWNSIDSRFLDLDNSGILDINEIIQQKIINLGFNLTQTPNLFFKFPWFSEPVVQNSGDGSATVSVVTKDLGFYMTPWIDEVTELSYCPKQEHYFSNNLVFKAMRDIVGVDTEGIYIAKKEGDSNSLMLIRESLLKNIWFYKENGVHIEPNDNNVSIKKVQFYWPPDEASPYPKKPDQIAFTVVRSNELSSIGGDIADSPQAEGNSAQVNQQNQNNISTTLPTHDRKIGCIPVTQN